MGRRLQKLHEKKTSNQLRHEFLSLQSTIALLEAKNVELKNQLKIALTEKSQKVDILQRNMETFLGDLEDKFLAKVNLLNNLEDEIKALSTTEHDTLKEHVCRLEETNGQLTNEAAHLQDSVDELRATTASLQAKDDRMFDEYQALKEAHDSLLLQLTEKDETIQGLLVC